MSAQNVSPTPIPADPPAAEDGALMAKSGSGLAAIEANTQAAHALVILSYLVRQLVIKLGC
jgi:hypothetical protein